MGGFVELKERIYKNGGYITNGMFVALSDIARVVECVDDYRCTNVITRDGKVHTLNEKYADVVEKIRKAGQE